MPIKKWVFQYTVALPLIFVLLSSVQYLKGRGLEYSIEFGIFWALITVFIFAITRVYYFRKNINCTVCNDSPNKNQKHGGG